jgi:hypothetical protein
MEPGPQLAATQAWGAQGDGFAPSQPRSRGPSASGALSSASLMYQQQGVHPPLSAGGSRRSLYGTPMGNAGPASSSVGVLTRSSSITFRCPLPDTPEQLFGADPAFAGLPGGPMRGAKPSHLLVAAATPGRPQPASVEQWPLTSPPSTPTDPPGTRDLSLVNMAEPGALAYLHAALPPAPGQHRLSHQGGLARAMAAVSDHPGPADLPPSAGLPPSGAGLMSWHVQLVGRGPSRRVSASGQRGTAVATAAAAGAPDARRLTGALAAPRARLSSPGALAAPHAGGVGGGGGGGGGSLRPRMAG